MAWQKFTLASNLVVPVKIHDVVNALDVDAVITPIQLQDFDEIDFTRFPCFKWNEFRINYQNICKLSVGESVLGLIWVSELFGDLEILKIEVARENRGSGKQYDFIGSCLIAFACSIAISSFKGKVVLIPYKEKVREHYYKHYNMEPGSSKHISSSIQNSTLLVRRFLNA